MSSNTVHPSRRLLLDATEALLCERGLAGAGIKQVVARSGAPIGSVYHFFPGGKRQLAAESLKMHSEKTLRLLEEFLANETQPLPKRLRIFFRNAAAGFEKAGCDKSCAIGAVALDLHGNNEFLRNVCNKAFDTWTAAIAAHLPWPQRADRLSFAQMIIAAIEGAFILARTQQSGAPFNIAGEWLAIAADLRSRRAHHINQRTNAGRKRSPNRKRRYR